jgi:2-deoxy-D-gluconate 3-dehydrogenase
MEYDVNNMFGIAGEVAIVTGASRGIGKEIAMALASLGAKVALVSVSAMNLFRTVCEFQKKGFDVIGIPTDTTKKESVQAMADQVFQQFGKIDILVNYAGVAHLEDAVSFEEAMWDWVMNVNLKGTFLTCQAVGKYMVQQKKGRIVNISSVLGLQGRAQDMAYAPSKAAMDQLTKSLAIEWAKDNINVNAVAPTFTTMDIDRGLLGDKEKYAWIINRIPKGRLCETRWIIGPVIFLCSPCSEFVTGHILYVDGGWTIS